MYCACHSPAGVLHHTDEAHAHVNVRAGAGQRVVFAGDHAHLLGCCGAPQQQRCTHTNRKQTHMAGSSKLGLKLSAKGNVAPAG